VLAHDFAEAVETGLDVGQHLHGVGRASGRGDRAGRGFGAQHAVRGHDGHDQHRRAVARNATDAMLVDHRVGVPVEATAHGRHGVGEAVNLFTIEFALVAGHHEGRQLDLGVTVLGDVTHDVVVVLVAEALASDLAVQGRDGRGGLGLVDAGGVAFAEAQLGKGVFGQAQLISVDDAGVVHHVERRQDAMAVGRDFNFGQSLKSFGPVDRAVAVHVGDVFAVGVDRHTLEAQQPGGGFGGLDLCRGRRGGDRNFVSRHGSQRCRF